MPTTFVNVPGVQINEVRLSSPPIAGVGTSIAGLVGKAPKTGQFTNISRLVTNADQFRADYILDATISTSLSRAVLGFFANGGQICYIVNTDSEDPGDIVKGIKLMEVIDEIAIIAAPGRTEKLVYDELETQASNTGDRFALLDPPTPKVGALTEISKGGGKRPTDSIYSAFYYPCIMVGPDLSGDSKIPVAVTPVGHIAGVYARVDATRGVHKAPANERIYGALGVEHALTDADQNALNIDGVNILRVFSEGVVIWGARTLLANDAADRTYMYINIRRLVNYIEESLQEGLRWAVFEPNTLTLRKQITRSVRGFLDRVWRDGGLFGATAEEAYYVRFPDMYNTDDERALGRLTVEIGLRAAYPAEFIIIRIGLLMQSATSS
jgi:phage tail sheath protein FI